MGINFECSRFLFLLQLSRSVLFHVIDWPLCGMWIWGVHCKVNSEKIQVVFLEDYIEDDI